MRDMLHFHMKLFGFMVSKYNNTKRKKESRDTGGYRIDFGINQIQPNYLIHTDKDELQHKLPHCNLSALIDMDHDLRSDIVSLLHYFDVEVNSDREKCRDPVRSKIVRKIYKAAGWLGPAIKWEYINISIRSRKDTLNKHRDEKNDRRASYNHGTVYSFLIPTIDDIYRIAIVMTFRSSVGAMIDRVHHLSRYRQDIIQTIIDLNERSVIEHNKRSHSGRGSTKREVKKFMRNELNKNDEWYDSVFNKAIETLQDEGVIVEHKQYYNIDFEEYEAANMPGMRVSKRKRRDGRS